AGATAWKKGQRVGVGWHGWHCGHCDPCRRGDFINCRNLRITGFSDDGGYAQYMIANADALALIPDSLSPAEAAPILCAGITTFNSLRHSGAGAGDLVAVLGLGGLGHLGVQFASKMGFRTVAIGRGKDKEPLALKLGAARYLDTDAVKVAEELTKMGGASVVLATAPDSKAMSALIDGLGVGGKLLVVGASADPISVTPIQLIGNRRSIQGWPSGSARDSEDTLNFCALTGIRPMVETFPLEQAAAGCERKGLLAQPPRSGPAYRQYSADHLSRIRFIRRAQALGFSLKEIKALLGLTSSPRTTCADVKSHADRKTAEIDAKIRDLYRMK